MSINQSDVESILDAAGLVRRRSTAKVMEYATAGGRHILYLRKDIGLPGYVRVVVHPNLDIAPFTALPGVALNSPKEFQHGSNMTAFPKRRNEGADEIHYGRALNITSVEALERFAKVFSRL